MNMSEMSPADYAAINGNNRDGDCWGGGWMIWLIVLVLFGWGGFGGGFGGGGFGGFGGGSFGGGGAGGSW